MTQMIYIPTKIDQRHHLKANICTQNHKCPTNLSKNGCVNEAILKELHRRSPTLILVHSRVRVQPLRILEFFTWDPMLHAKYPDFLHYFHQLKKPNPAKPFPFRPGKYYKTLKKSIRQNDEAKRCKINKSR